MDAVNSNVELSKEELASLWLRGYEDPVFFAKTFLSHWVPKEMPFFHRAALAILLRKTDFLLKYGEIDQIIREFVYKTDPNDDASGEVPLFRMFEDKNGERRLKLTVSKFVEMMWPRSFSKTTLINIAVLYMIEYDLQPFIVYLSESGQHSEMQLANIKRELESNALLRAVFGNKVPDRMSNKKWTANHIELDNSEVKAVISRGRGAQVRGLDTDGTRPTLIIVDDVEDKESVQTEEQRTKAREWFYEDVIPALPTDPNMPAMIFVAGTLLHPDALLQRLRYDSQWTCVVLGATKKDNTPLWPDMWPQSRLEEKKASFLSVGNPAGYYREFHNKIRPEEGMTFKREYFRYDIHIPAEIVARALAVDPAISAKRSADYCCLGVVGKTAKGHFGVLDFVAKIGMDPRELIDTYFMLYGTWWPELAGVESVAYQAALLPLIREEMFKRGGQYIHDCIPIPHGGKKIEKIKMTLGPRYKNGGIIHRLRWPLLESMLLDFPNGKLDGPDMVSMAIIMLDPYAAVGSFTERSAISLPPLGDWRN